MPHPHSTAWVAGHPVYAMLAPIPFACFAGALLTDIAYAGTANIQWANMSAWLLTVGLLLSVLVVIAGVIGFFGERRIYRAQAGWIHALAYGLAMLLSIINAFVHSRDAYTSVVPEGLALSAIVVLLLVVAGWSGWRLVYRAAPQELP